MIVSLGNIIYPLKNSFRMEFVFWINLIFINGII